MEVLLTLSLIAGIALSRRLFHSLTFATDGVRLIQDGELTSRLLEVGQPEVDRLIGVYNRMADNLRGERTRLQEQQYFLARILQVSPTGVLILDFDGLIADANPAAGRLLDRPVSSLKGSRLDRLGGPLGDIVTTLPTGDTAVVGLSGARRVKVHRGRFLDRGFSRAFFLIEELTEELRQFERSAYEKLIRVMSHEVNNSVAASNSLLHSSLTYGASLDPESRTDFERALRIVIDRTEQLNAFMQRFADVFRLPPPARSQCDLVELIETLVRLLSARPDASGTTWQWQVNSRPVPVSIDRGQMEQALMNVLKNAVEAAGSTGTIGIRITSDHGHPELVVEDSGPDLTAEALANLFTPFFSTKPLGQGIGLTVVQEILTAHGCRYAIERPPGGPTRFTVRF